jgi:hypothetical protein
VFHSLIAKTVSWASRRRAIVVAALVCTLAVAVFGARRLTFDPDVLSLLPRDGRALDRNVRCRQGRRDEALFVLLLRSGMRLAADETH